MANRIAVFPFSFNLLFLYFNVLDPAVDNVDENLLNLAYNDQQIDVDDEVNRIKNRQCCDGIYAGRWHEEDRIRESTIGNYG